MPVRPLPLALVNRLRRIVKKEEENAARRRAKSRVYKVLGRMKNVDHRQDSLEPSEANKTDLPGLRVRQLNVSRNFPGLQRQGIVIKRVHFSPAVFEISDIQTKARKHNRRCHPERYVLREPYVYTIGEFLVVMAKADFPNIIEVLGVPRSFRRYFKLKTKKFKLKTERGKRFFKKLERQHKVRKKDLEKAFVELMGNEMFSPQNVLLLGYWKGKFIFMPLIDIE